MMVNDLNNILSVIAEQPTRENILELSFALLQWMQIEPNAGNKPQLVSPQTQKLKDYLETAPQTVQPQLYRLSADNQNIRVRFAVLKKLKKDYIAQLVDNDPGLTSYQASIKGIVHIPGKPQYVPQQPYFIHFVTTPEYNRLILIFNQGDHKRIVSFRNRLTNTQYNKIIQAWQGIGKKSKPEIADIFWKSLDIKEVNKEFYNKIKERFDALLGIVKNQHAELGAAIAATDNQVKQFTIRFIGRYIFCWFLKEKGIIPYQLISKNTITETENYYQTVLLKLFFETLNTKVQDRGLLPSHILFKTIPYLNGGLFDETEEDRLFSHLQLDAWLLPFVDILEGYDFTVDESSSQYQQVAVDPEMLGRIFENLLASQNEETEKLANQRKAFGAFYTPREIVDYMVNESIKAYLQTEWEEYIIEQKTKVINNPEPIGDLFGNKEHQQLALEIKRYELKAEEKDKIEKAIAPLFLAIPNADGLKKEEKVLLLGFLERIKILDPACGSGAFPMGILHKLVELHELLGTVKSSYELKKDILSQNIHGVDIMPMAIEIARLRAWLSLVLEEEYKPTDAKHNFGVKPLPNLDFKFVCANSLIELGLDAYIQQNRDTFNKGFTLQLVEQLMELEKLRKQFFIPALASTEKEKLQVEYLEKRDEVVAAIKTKISDNYLKEVAEKLKQWNPFDDSKPSPFFSPTWMFGVDNGFDVVIGNPPWGADLSKNDKLLYKKIYHNIDSSTPNSFAYFIGFAKRQSKSSFNYVLPDSILIKDFQKTRRLIGDNVSSIQWYQNTGLPEELRPFVYVEHDVCVVHALAKCLDSIIVELFPYSEGKIHYIKKKTDKKKILLHQFDYAYNLMIDDDDLSILQKINNAQKIDFLEAHEGIHTGNSRKLLFKKDCKDKDCKDLFYGASAGDTIKNYYSKTSGWKVFYNKNVIDKKVGLYASLREERIFENPKIYITRTGNPFKAFYDKNTYASNNFFSLQFRKAEENTEENLISILPFILSTLCQYFIRRFAAPRLGNTFVETKIIHLLKFKIPTLNTFIKYSISQKVYKIIELKKSKQDTSALEKEIDVLVYKLYELTYDEVKIVDPNFWLTEAEYEAVTV